MNLIDLTPPASSLIESIRSIGYSFESAIADIIDNSISAKSKNVAVNVEFLTSDNLTVSILDDGTGMSETTLKMAMSLGGNGPSATRQNSDLGRFGLGLKTASFSQAKVLIVISKLVETDSYYGIEWNLNHVVETNKWEALELNHNECLEKLLSLNINAFPKGTLVTWSTCDRITQNIKNIAELNIHVNRLIEHLNQKLSLVFHKFLDKKIINIKLNNKKILAMDPFCLKGDEDTPRASVLFAETFPIENTNVTITAYLLPHVSRMGGAKRENLISINSDHTAAQGLYMYRLNRLISSGGWQNIVRKSEANKLARIDISFGNDADHLWQLDIKKSTAILPLAIRAKLRDLIRNISSKSQNIFNSRTRMRKTNPNSVWERMYDKDSKTISYHIDRQHPIIERLLSEFGAKENIAEDLIVFIENTFPTDLIANDIVTNDVTLIPSSLEIELKIGLLADVVSNAEQSFEIFKSTILSCGLFNINPLQLDSILNNNKVKFKL